MLNVKNQLKYKGVIVFILFIAFVAMGFKLTIKNANTASNPLTLSDFLDEMITNEKDVEYPVSFYASKMQSSYDRRSLIPGTPSWHANDDGAGFVRYEANNGRVERVLFDEKGPGVITRIITTGKAAGTNLRIYFDDEPEASITIPAFDISQFPVKVPKGLLYLHEHYKTRQGSSFYYPIPYGKRCKITVDDLNRTYYFHANYRSYDPATLVKTFTIKDAEALQEKTEQVSNRLLNPVTYADGKISKSKKLKKGAILSLDLPAGSKAVRTLRFNVSGYDKANYGQLMRGLIVKLNFDGKQTVWTPLSDLSGAGMGAPKVDTYYLTADGNGDVAMRFIMPYKKAGKLEIENVTSISATVAATANVSDWKWLDNTLYFHAGWRQQRGLVTNAGLDYNMATITGRGVFKGDVLSLYNHSKRWYGEGDEHIWVDDEKFPSHFGCGTEDYYNTTFAPIHVYFLPFGGAPREDDEASRGYNTFLRTRNLDIVPFKSKLQFEFELISWDGGLVDYSSTVYWYGDIDSKILQPSGINEALHVLPPAIYTTSK